MSDPRPSPLARASSEPDLNALPDLYEESLVGVDLQFEAAPLVSINPSVDQPALTLSLTPLTLPTAEPVEVFQTTSVSFTEYVATELARSAVVPGVTDARPEPSVEGIARFLGPDEAGLVRPMGQSTDQQSRPPKSPRSPRSPRTLRLRKPTLTPPPPRFDIPTPNGTSSTTGSAAGSQYALNMRLSKLPCTEIDEEGTVRKRLMTRMDIMKEARETLHKSHPSPSAAAAWMRQLDGGQLDVDESTPQMDSFACLMDTPVGSDSDDGGPKRRNPKKALREYLHKYLRNSLQPRDIRQVDPAFAAKPALWIRHTALVISMEGLRAIVFRSKVLLFQPDSKRTQQAVDIAQKFIRVQSDLSDQQPFEFKALEAILIHVLGGLDHDFCNLKPEIERNLTELPKELNPKKLEDLRLQKQKLNQFHSRATIVQDILEKLLDEDEDMANMYLTEKHTNPKRARNVMEHDEVEMLLEAYLQGVDELVNQSSLLSDQIEDTEDLVMIHLDALRNRLLSVELALSVVTMTFGAGSVVSGVFGMNLPMPLFDEGASSYWFLSVVLVILSFVVGVSWLVLHMLQKRGLYSFH